MNRKAHHVSVIISRIGWAHVAQYNKSIEVRRMVIPTSAMRLGAHQSQAVSELESHRRSRSKLNKTNISHKNVGTFGYRVRYTLFQKNYEENAFHSKSKINKIVREKHSI